jgi:hypothetical protein
MPTRFAYAVGAFAVGFGLFVLFGLALPTLREGSTVLGALALACAVLGIALGAAGLIGTWRSKRRL